MLEFEISVSMIAFFLCFGSTTVPPEPKTENNFLLNARYSCSLHEIFHSVALSRHSCFKLMFVFKRPITNLKNSILLVNDAKITSILCMQINVHLQKGKLNLHKNMTLLILCVTSGSNWNLQCSEL